MVEDLKAGGFLDEGSEVVSAGGPPCKLRILREPGTDEA
jgi:hypothetical protein